MGLIKIICILVLCLSVSLYAELTLISQSFSSVMEPEIPATSKLEVLSIEISELILSEIESEVIQIIQEEIIDFAKIKAEIIGKPLNFPNPFRIGEGTKIGYRLSKPMDIDIYIYDSYANLIFQQHFEKGVPNGGDYLNYNKVDLNRHGFNTKNVSAGIYFFLIMQNGTLLGKGKMAIIP